MNIPIVIVTTAIVSAAVYMYYTGYMKSRAVQQLPTFKRLILVRHGEKPPNGLGNLDCKGLNRSLALPEVLLRKFGKPDYIFAPNPARKIKDCYNGKDGHICSKFNYIRPLVTIEPTAVKCNLPINSDYGFTDIEGLLREFALPKYTNKTIFVAWEHKNLDKFAKMFANMYAHGKSIPDWPSDDFDSIFIFEKWSPTHYTFHIDKEGLNNVNVQCPV